MNDKLVFFSTLEGNLLVRLLLAHLLADFVFQTSNMVKNKKFVSWPMLTHVFIVFALTTILTGGNLYMAGVISILHWIIDGLKVEALKRRAWNETALFITDQLLHIIVIVIVWCFFAHVWGQLTITLFTVFTSYRYSLILLGYTIVTTPVGYLIKQAIQGLNITNAENVQTGGKWIGIFERIIIFTLVLLGQYTAIGFLITGKSILRYAGDDEHLKSEYVLVGTMMSYAAAILSGVVINWLLRL